MTQHDHRKLLAYRDALLDTLTHAAKQRDRRPGLVNTPDGPECEWVVHERQVMLREVNTFRATRGLPPLGFAEVKRADRQAAGHADYAQKFALYCAELVMGDQ